MDRKWYQKKATWAMIIGVLTAATTAFAFVIDANVWLKATFGFLTGVAFLAQNVFLGQREEKETASVVQAVKDLGKPLLLLLCLGAMLALPGCGQNFDARQTALSATRIAGTVGYGTVLAHKLTKPGVTPEQDAEASAAFTRFSIAILQAQTALAADDNVAFESAIVQAGMEIATIMQISAATCPVLTEGGSFNKDKEKD